MSKLIAGLFSVFLSCHAIAADKEIVIGMIVQVTGAQAADGVLQTNATKLAVSQINAAGGIGGKQVVLKIEDNKSTPEGTLEAFKALTAIDKIVAIIGPLFTQQMIAIAPSIEKSKIPVLSGTTLSRLSGPEIKWFLRVRPPELVLTKGMAAFIKDNLKLKKVAIIGDSGTFGANNANFFKKYADEKGLEVVTKTLFPPGTKDFKPTFEEIAKAKPDVVVTFCNDVRSVILIIKDYKAYAGKFKYVGSATTLAESVLSEVGDASNGLMAAVDSVPYENDYNKKYQDEYRAMFKSNPDILMSWNFDAVNLLAAAMKKGGTDRTAIRDALMGLKNFETLQGPMSFNEIGEGIHTLTIAKYEKGKMNLVERLKP